MVKILPGAERWIKQALTRRLRRLHRRQNKAPVIIDGVTIRRILVVRTDKIGDVLVSTPLMADLQVRFPHARIDIVLGRSNRAVAPLLQLSGVADFTGRGAIALAALLRRVRARRYDLVVNMHPNDAATAALITVLSGGRITVGFENIGAAFYDLAVPIMPGNEHAVAINTQLAAAVGAPRRPDDAVRMAIVVPSEARAAARAIVGDRAASAPPLIVINISCSAQIRAWGRDHFIALAQQLRAMGFGVLMIAAPADAAQLKDIATASGADLLPARDSLAEVVAVLSCADLIVSPDTAVVHFAAALGKPVVSLHESVAKGRAWHAWGVPQRWLSDPEGIAKIASADVADAVMGLMREALPAKLAELRPAETAR